MQNESRVVLFPGLAADARLFAPMREVWAAGLPRLETPELPAPARRDESLAEYARRLADVLSRGVLREALAARAAYWVGGFSFGSQLAQEVAAHLSPSPRGLVLLCAVRGRHQILPSFRMQERVGRLIPGAVARRLYGPYAKRFAARCGLGPEQTRLLVEMACANDPAFLAWSSRACAEWGGVATPTMPVLHVHGALDAVIPDVRGEATRTIAGAGHLITMTHAWEVVAAVREFVEVTGAAGGANGEDVDDARTRM